MPGIILSIDLSEPIFLMAFICCEEVLEGEVLLGEELARHLVGLALVERLLGLLDEGEHVAHVEDAAGHPVGVEDLEVGDLLTGRGEHDRLAGDLGDRQGRATAGVAVELGQDDTGEGDALVEGLGGLDRGLADHRVDDEEDLVGLRSPSRMSAACCMRFVVDGEAAGGVDDDDVVLLGPRLLDAHPGDGDGVTERPGALAGAEDGVVAAHVAALGREDGDAGALADDLELGDGVGALEVGRDEERRVPWSLSHLPSLPAKVVLPEPCRPASMMTVGGCLAKRIVRVCPPRIATSSSCTILTTCWAGLSAWLTSAPRARSRTEWVNRLTTGSATSASSRARRMSRIVALTSDSVSRPLPRRFLKVAVSRSDRDANTGQGYPLAAEFRPRRTPDAADAAESLPTSRLAALPRWRSGASQVSMIIATACAARAGGERPPPNSVT